MALIKCIDCGSDVSDQAKHCIKCGAPIAAEGIAAGVELTTTQETSKRLKTHILLSLALFLVGFVAIIVVSGSEEAGEAPSVAPFLIMFGGLMWFIVTKFRVWWHHK